MEREEIGSRKRKERREERRKANKRAESRDGRIEKAKGEQRE